MIAQSSELSIKIDEFLNFLEFDRHLSPLTIRNYTHYLTRFSKYVSKKIKNPKLKDINILLVELYKKELFGFGLSSKTLGFHLIVLRGFLKWLRDNGTKVLNIEQIKVPKVAPSKIDFLSGSDVERLLGSPDLKQIGGKRDRAIMEVLYSTGLRVSDLTTLDRGLVNSEKKELVILGNRRKKARAVFLSLRALGWVENYLKVRKDNLKPLFVSHKGNPSRLTPRSVQRMIKKYTRKIGLSAEVTPKTLRHSFATDLLMAGADIRSVQEMLGHKNISTMQIYTHVTNRQLREVHQAFHHVERGRRV